VGRKSKLLTLIFAVGLELYISHWPAAGETTLGLANVLLLLGALVPDVELLFEPLGKPEFGALVAIPLSEFVAPGVP
jgi:hypothetical protein